MTRFQDFNFKLIVLEQLMYTEKKLVPAFDFSEQLEAQGIHGDPWMHAYHRGLFDRVVPEARDHFESLNIPADLLHGVDEVIIEGGLSIYHHCSPCWDGETDLFAVFSLVDLPLVPNLRRVIGTEYLAPHLRDELRAHNITTD